jgi:hypothetical protein
LLRKPSMKNILIILPVGTPSTLVHWQHRRKLANQSFMWWRLHKPGRPRIIRVPPKCWPLKVPSGYWTADNYLWNSSRWNRSGMMACRSINSFQCFGDITWLLFGPHYNRI